MAERRQFRIPRFRGDFPVATGPLASDAPFAGRVCRFEPEVRQHAPGRRSPCSRRRYLFAPERLRETWLDVSDRRRAACSRVSQTLPVVAVAACSLLGPSRVRARTLCFGCHGGSKGLAQPGQPSAHHIGLCGMVRAQCTIPPQRGSPEPSSNPSLVLVELQPGNPLAMDPFSSLLASLLLGISLFAAGLVLSLALLEGVKRRGFRESPFAIPSAEVVKSAQAGTTGAACAGLFIGLRGGTTTPKDPRVLRHFARVFPH